VYDARRARCRRRRRLVDGSALHRFVHDHLVYRRWSPEQIEHDATPYRKRHRIENMFGRMKDSRCVAMRFDRCADIFLFLFLFALAAIVLFWL
jgi:hypothetical protein